MKFLFINIVLLFCIPNITAQEYFFLPTRDDFLIYSISKQTVIKPMNYHKSPMQGLLWRPTSDMGFIFAKNIPESPQLIRMRVSDKKIDRFHHRENFSDFQVINKNFIVVRSNNTLCLWNLNTNNCMALTNNFHGIYFAYDINRHLLVTQDNSNILILHFLHKKQEQFLDKVEENTHFTLFQGKLYYFNTSSSWVVYTIDTEETQQYTLAGKHHMRSIWPTDTGFLIKELVANSATEIPGWKLFIYNKDQFFSDEILSQAPTPQAGGVSIESNSLITPLERVNILD